MRFFMQLPPQEKRMTRATIFTLMRIAVVPVVVWCIFQGNWYWSALFFGIASITDCVDGNIARWCNEKTALGALLDPVADKLLIIFSLFALVTTSYAPFALPTWFFWSIIGKEFFVASGTLFLYTQKRLGEVKPTFFGKISTMVHMVTIWWVLFLYGHDGSFSSAAFLLGVATFLAITVSFQYACLGIHSMIFGFKRIS